MLKIAITGNIASGKSQVEQIISRKYPVYDTDKIAHKILEKIEYFYGYDIFSNGKPDRQKLGKLVFTNKELRKKLEDIIHPEVKKEIEKLFKLHENIVFISIPLLFETGMNTMFDKIIFVETDDSIRLDRLMKRNNLTKNEAMLRINSQQSQDEKIKKSDYIISNNSTLESLEQQVLVLITKLESLV